MTLLNVVLTVSVVHGMSRIYVSIIELKFWKIIIISVHVSLGFSLYRIYFPCMTLLLVLCQIEEVLCQIDKVV